MPRRRTTDALTLRGRAFVAVGVALVVCGILLGFRDITRAGVLVAGLPVLVLVLSRTQHVAMTTRRDVAPAVVPVDEPGDVQLFITNPGTRATPIMMAEEQLDYALGDRPRFVIPRMGAGVSHQLHYRVRCSVRGRHQLGPLGLRIKDPFELTIRHAIVPGVGELIVLPKVVPLLATRIIGGLGSEGSVPHMIALHGEDDVSVREYRDGDDLRRIHWPATARTGDLMVRQEERPATRRAVLLLDNRAQCEGEPRPAASFEWAVTAAASILALVIPSGVAARLALDGRVLGDATRDALRLDDALIELAVADTSDSPTLVPSIEAAAEAAAGGALCVAVVCPLPDHEADLLSRVRAPGSAGIALVQELPGLSAEAAGATAARLRDRGWGTVVVTVGMGVAEAWSSVETAAAGVR